MSNSRRRNILNRVKTFSFEAPWEKKPCKVPRSFDRAPVFRFAYIRYGGGSEISCLVLDISEKGARIALDGASSLPATVRLFIPQQMLKIDASVRWQRGLQVGLEFNAMATT